MNENSTGLAREFYDIGREAEVEAKRKDEPEEGKQGGAEEEEEAEKEEGEGFGSGKFKSTLEFKVKTGNCPCFGRQVHCPKGHHGSGKLFLFNWKSFQSLLSHGISQIRKFVETLFSPPKILCHTQDVEPGICDMIEEASSVIGHVA